MCAHMQLGYSSCEGQWSQTTQLLLPACAEPRKVFALWAIQKGFREIAELLDI